MYRNALVHDRDEEAELVPITGSRHHLAEYFAWLPIRWGH